MDRMQIVGWLRTGDGQSLLEAAERLPSDRLVRITQLRRRVPPELAAAAVELLELRRQARQKFASADRLFFTREGLEQSTGESIAAYRASRFPEGAPVLDACCGVGGDALALASRGPVLAVDRNPVAAACANANALALRAESRYPVRALCADVTKLDLAALRAADYCAFVDPSRRVDRADGGRMRARTGRDYQPSLDWIETLRRSLPTCAVKVSPGIDDDELRRGDADVEFLSDRGECKEAVLWFGDLRYLPSSPSVNGDRYRATVLRPGAPPATLAPFTDEPTAISAPRSWLYEPDPAVIRAHRVRDAAAILGAAQIDSEVAFLTSDAYVATPFAVGYRVLEWLPFNLKAIRVRLRALGRRAEVIKRRGAPQDPDDIRRLLKGAGFSDGPPTVIALTRWGGRPIAILCEPPADAACGH